MLVYATSAQLATWTGEAAPANADLLLRSASILVALAAGQNLYGAAPSGSTAEALRDATTAQAAAWIALGVTPTSGGALTEAPVKRSSIGTGTVERDTALLAQARADAVAELVDEARAILAAAGLLLLDLPVWTSGDDRLLDYGLGGTWPHAVPRDSCL